MYMKEYERWCKYANKEVVKELKELDQNEIEDAFYCNLRFGTGGLRGKIGVGTNRINIYTVAKASQGLSNYLVRRFGPDASVCIGYDSRIKSDEFAVISSCVFAANNIKVNIWPKLSPVSTVSFAVRYLHTSAGIMITASHNPSIYNGYKVYNADGCQITTEVATEVFAEIEKIDIFTGIQMMDFDVAIASHKIDYIPDSVFTSFINETKNQSVLYGENINRDICIVYSPLNGTGYIPVTRALSEMGYTNITLVEEQRYPDEEFTTCPYPNPENADAMALGIQYAEKLNADLLLATDPDCDRVGIAIKDNEGKYLLLSGNETGILLLDYICSQRVKHNKMPDNPIAIKTIVSTDMAEQICANYGVSLINVLTGFKFIGEQIGHLDKLGKLESYIFGFEESYGYLSGTHVRDKDGVSSAILICEMFCYYRAHNTNFTEKLNELYEKYGYSINTLHSYRFEGSAGHLRIKKIMDIFRYSVGPNLNIHSFDNRSINKKLDYMEGIDGLPSANVLKYYMEGDCSIVIRPSGTEPKLKIYISISSSSKDDAIRDEKRILAELKQLLE